MIGNNFHEINFLSQWRDFAGRIICLKCSAAGVAVFHCHRPSLTRVLIFVLRMENPPQLKVLKVLPSGCVLLNDFMPEEEMETLFSFTADRWKWNLAEGTVPFCPDGCCERDVIRLLCLWHPFVADLRFVNERRFSDCVLSWTVCETPSCNNRELCWRYYVLVL